MKIHPTRFRGSLLILSLMASAALVSGCFSDGKTGPAGPAGATGATGATGGTGPTGPAGPGTAPIDKVAAESCATCHTGAIQTGSGHQAKYDVTRDASNLGLTIQGVTSGPNAGDATKFDGVMTIYVSQNGADYNAGIESYVSNGSTRYRIKGLDQQTFYTVDYDSAQAIDKFTSSQSFSFGPNSFQGAGVYELYATAAAFDPKPVNGEAYGYVAQGPVGYPNGHVQLYDNVTNAGLAFGDLNDANTGYVSAANVAACEACHGSPYGKHGYRQAKVDGLPDFASCKACHYDTRDGHDQAWQQSVNDPYGWATNVSATDAKYGTAFDYKARIMNDVHMSHAMEFPYPQSMASCTTCHAGKLDTILTDANFTAVTCKSCHPVTTDATNKQYQPERDPGTSHSVATGQWKKAPALETLWAEGQVSWHSITDNCSTCHSQAGGYIGESFKTFHSGYNPQIYKADGTRYNDIYKATVDSVSVTGNIMDIKFHVDESVAQTLHVTTPQVLVAFYGWNAKQFIISNHTSDANGKRMEKTIGTPNTLFTEVDTGVNGSWEVQLDLSAWVPPTGTTESIPAMVASHAIKKAEIAILPTLTWKFLPASAAWLSTDPTYVAPDYTLTAALDAATYTYDFTANGPVSNYFEGSNAVVDVTATAGTAHGCNSCHDALGTTFHTGDRGGNVTVCRMCHVTTSGGSHIEMQSRGIDSYVHSIHEFQTLDRKNVDFTDPVYAKRYEDDINFFIPTFTLDDCEACHRPGTYNIPDQTQSMPGLLSKANANNTDPRDIDNVPAYVTGPASRACGSCHRAYMIKTDLASSLASFNEHTATFGYMVDPATTDEGNNFVYKAIDKIMGMFN